MLITVMKNLQKLSYVLKIFALEDGKARSMWEQMGGRISILGPEQYGCIDWLIFEGIIVDSLEAKEAISSLMQEPFCLVSLVWIIQEDILANCLLQYEEMGWKHIVSHWETAFSRANVIVFPDFTLLMLYSVLDTGNFFVVPGSPEDVWAAESYSKLPSLMTWVASFLTAFARSFTSDFAARLGLLDGSVRHYGLNSDVSSVILMADIVLYGSDQDVQGFRPLLIRAMTFGIPVIAPDFPILKKHLEDRNRMEGNFGACDDLYRNARKAEKLKFDANERDEGELERTGQTLCIYEIYSGAGSWPFLHHGSLYHFMNCSLSD